METVARDWARVVFYGSRWESWTKGALEAPTWVLDPVRSGSLDIFLRDVMLWFEMPETGGRRG